MTADEYRAEAARLRNLARWVAYKKAPLRELASIFEALAKADDALARSALFVATKRMLTAPRYSVFATQPGEIDDSLRQFIGDCWTHIWVALASPRCNAMSLDFAGADAVGRLRHR